MEDYKEFFREMETTSKIRKLYLSLGDLEKQMSQLEPIHLKWLQEGPGHIAGVVGGLFNRDLRMKSDREFWITAKNKVCRIALDWKRFTDFSHYVLKLSGVAVDEHVRGMESLLSKIVAVADKYRTDLDIQQYHIYQKPSKVIQVVDALRTKTDILKEEGKQAFLRTAPACSFKPHSPLREFYVLEQLAGFVVRDILDDFRHIARNSLRAFEEKLTAHLSFLGHVRESIRHAVQVLPNDHLIIEDLFDHAASVVLRIAHVSCSEYLFEVEYAEDYLIERWTEIRTTQVLLDLRPEIDPVASEFMGLNLKFLEAIPQIRASLTTDQVESLVDCFFMHVLGEKPVDWLDKQELKSLVIFLVDKPEQAVNQDLEFFLAEIRETIKEALSLNQRWRQGLGTEPLDARIWLLKQKYWLLAAEIFLNDQSSSSTASTVSAEEQIQALMQGEKNLRAIFEKLQKEELQNVEQAFDNGEQAFDNGKQTLALIKEWAINLTSLNQSSDANEIKDKKVRISIHILLSRVALSRAKSVLMDLLNVNETMVAQRNDEIQALLEGLKFLMSFVTDKQVENLADVGMILTHIESVGRRITSRYYSVLANQIKSSDLLDQIELVKAKVRDACPQIPSSNFPKSDGIGFLDFLIGNVLELLKHDPDAIAPVQKHHIREIQLELEVLRYMLIRILEPDIDDLGTRVTKMAYEVEYVIDSIEVGIGGHWQQLSWLYYLLEEIRLIKVQATQILEEKNPKDKVHNIAHISSHTSGARTPKFDKAVVSLRDQEEAIIDRLTRGSSHRDIVSIVGMPGIGKTTIAKSVYNNPNVVYHFHRRAWCFVSQIYGKRDLLFNILRDIHGLTDEIQGMNNGDLELKVSQCLRKNRYLIVMDDVWNVGAWNDLERSFPDDGNGSRVLITSRLRKVPLEAKLDSDPHYLRALSEDESWKLLEMNIFHGGGCCPQELLEVGKEIAEHCKGLPLAVIAVAGILRKTEKKFDWWKKIAKELNSRVIDETETQCKNILELSFNQLPIHLKGCFLYFGAFQADKDIQVNKLMRLWIAEGFVRKVGQRSLEEIAEDYLTDLIDRSLVIICKRRSAGGIKECRVHDLLRDLCQKKSEEGHFFQLIHRYDEPSASFHSSDYGVDFDYFPLNPETYENRRLSICLKRKDFVDSRPYGPRTRSLIFFASSDAYPRRPYNISFICQQFKLLRVLDLESINMGISFPAEIELLVQLRYLAISGDVDSVPSSIVNLWKLETLILRGLSGKVALPDTFWCMTWLRHVHVTNHAAFNLQHAELGTSFQLENLITFSSPSLSIGEDAEKMLRKLPNLRSFRCIFSQSLGSSTSNFNKFPRLDFLTQLESLKIIYSGRARCLGEFNLPLNLKKLTLSNFGLPWSHISTIGRLPNLEVLKLHFGAFDGQMWEMREEEFCELKFLQLDSLNIAQWNASYDHLPKLEQLVLRNCKDLEEVPCDFAEICTLQMIQVQWCRKSLEESVKNIEEAVEGLQVLISRS